MELLVPIECFVEEMRAIIRAHFFELVNARRRHPGACSKQDQVARLDLVQLNAVQPVVRASQKAFAVQNLKHFEQGLFDLRVSTRVLQIVELRCEVFEVVLPRG